MPTDLILNVLLFLYLFLFVLRNLAASNKVEVVSFLFSHSDCQSFLNLCLNEGAFCLKEISIIIISYFSISRFINLAELLNSFPSYLLVSFEILNTQQQETSLIILISYYYLLKFADNMSRTLLKSNDVAKFFNQHNFHQDLILFQEFAPQDVLNEIRDILEVANLF